MVKNAGVQTLGIQRYCAGFQIPWEKIDEKKNELKPTWVNKILNTKAENFYAILYSKILLLFFKQRL